MSSHQLTLASRLEELPRANDFLAGLADSGEVTQNELLTLQLILEEVLVNVICHGQPATPDEPIEIALRLSADDLEMEITDGGAPFDPLTAPPPDVTAPLEDRPIGGLGIHLVKKLSDSVGYRRSENRNHLWLTRGREK